MASLVTAPLERQFGQMPSLSQMTSISSSGSSLITLKFALDLSLDVAEQEVQAAINASSGYLPSGMPSPPIYSKVNPADTPIITLALTSTSVPLSKIEDFAETRLAQKISQISGVGLVSVSGGQRPAVRIKVNSKLLASFGLSTSDVRSAITNANVNAAKGNFDGESVAYTIDANDQLLTSAEYGDLVVAYQDDAVVRLNDVAEVVDDVENIRQSAWVNEDPAIIINVRKQPGANVIKVVDNIKGLLPKLSAALPNDIKLQILSDRTQTIRASVDDVKQELILSVILVIVVMFCFLRSFSATVIPSIAVPLSLVGTFGVMYLFGFSINNLTLMSLTIATGFVVDDAIVMIENISRFIEMGEKPMDAAFKGAGQIGFTIMSLTISLIAVLIPLLFMEDVIGRLFKEFAVTLAVAIIISAFISLTLTPMLCARILKHDEQHGKKGHSITSWLEHSLNWLIEQYRKSLKFVLKHQRGTLVVAIITMAITGWLFFLIPKGFFPVQDNGMIQAISEIRQDASFDKMAEQQQELSKVILQDPAVVSISSFIGIDGTNITQNSGRMLINLKDKDKRGASINQVINRIKNASYALSGINLYLQPVQDLSIDDRVSRSTYQYSVGSHDTDEVTKYSDIILGKLKQYAQLKNIASDQQNKGLQIHIEIDRDNASQLGITMQNIVDALYDLFGQRQISTIFTERNQYYVVLEGDIRANQEQKFLDNVYIKSSSGAMVPLKSLTKITRGYTPLVVTRQSQFPVATLSFDIAENSSLGEALDVVHEATKQLGMPEHIETSFQGTALAFTKSFGNEIWLMLAAVVVVYLVLGILYESYIHPVTILSTLPSACMGALVALILAGNDLDVISVIGIILLIGIVKKNAIMMIDFALEQQHTGKKAVDAIFEACILRFRPILMTTMAALLGAIPLVVSGGVGSEIRSPLGITIIGGLVVSQILTLYTTPVIYLMFDRLAKRFTKASK
jgi:multidrug efflux pump